MLRGSNKGPSRTPASSPTSSKKARHSAGIERKLRENQVEIPLPQRDLHLRSGKLTIETRSGGHLEAGLQTD